MQVTLTWVPWPPGEDSELLALARTSPDPLAFPVPGVGSGSLLGGPLSVALSVVLAELSRELLLELGEPVSKCCCSGPGAPQALSAGR